MSVHRSLISKMSFTEIKKMLSFQRLYHYTKQLADKAFIAETLAHVSTKSKVKSLTQNSSVLRVLKPKLMTFLISAFSYVTPYSDGPS